MGNQESELSEQLHSRCDVSPFLHMSRIRSLLPTDTILLEKASRKPTETAKRKTLREIQGGRKPRGSVLIPLFASFKDCYFIHFNQHGKF